MGISEMRWPGFGQTKTADHVVYYSGGDDTHHQYRVGVILTKRIATSVYNFTPVTDRIMLVQLKAYPVDVNIIQIYAPTADKIHDEEVEKFYNTLSETLRLLNKNHVNIIMGDLNAKIGKGAKGDIVGSFGLGERNERGERLQQFCIEEDYVILNTFFKLPPRRLYTWRSPMDTVDHVVRNQIDYIMINKRFRNSFTSVKTYPGADVASDHNALVGMFKCRVKKITKSDKKVITDTDKLKLATVRVEIAHAIEENFKYLDNSKMQVEESWREIKTKIKDPCDKFLKKEKSVQQKSWMTEDILELMNLRRQYKNKDIEKYNEIHKLIRKEVRKAKDTSMKEECNNIELLESKHDLFNMHKQIRAAAGLSKKTQTTKMTDEFGHMVIDITQKLSIWKKYIVDLFNINRPPKPKINSELTGPVITQDETRKVIMQIKDGKAVGPDEIHGEVLKHINDESMKILTDLFNKIYDTGIIPLEWLESTFIALPKKPSAKSCSDHRTISLMSHILKIFLKIIHGRIHKKCEESIGKTQFGFRNALGTREALFCIQVLFQRCRDMNCDIYACFIDYQKAFDSVLHDKLIQILQNIGLDDKDMRIITNLYWNQTASVRIENQHTDSIQIQRGVRQGCVLSPLLFNSYSEEIFKEALENTTDGILVNGEVLNNFRYADDTVIFADSLEGLQRLMNKITSASEAMGLALNASKTKYMVISKQPVPPGQLYVHNRPIEKVDKIKYLGCTFDDKWDHSLEVRCRIEAARAAFTKMKKLLCSHDLNINTKVRLLRCYVFSVLLYGVESWTLTEAACKKIEAFEMWTYRRMLRISWKDRVTNKHVLERLKKDTEIIFQIKKRKLEYLGHVMRNDTRYGVLQLILQGKVFGKRGPGRRRISWLKNLRQWFSATTTELFRAAVNKIKIANMIANIRTG